MVVPVNALVPLEVVSFSSRERNLEVLGPQRVYMPGPPRGCFLKVFIQFLYIYN